MNERMCLEEERFHHVDAVYKSATFFQNGYTCLPIPVDVRTHISISVCVRIACEYFISSSQLFTVFHGEICGQLISYLMALNSYSCLLSAKELLFFSGVCLSVRTYEHKWEICQAKHALRLTMCWVKVSPPSVKVRGLLDKLMDILPEGRTGWKR